MDSSQISTSHDRLFSDRFEDRYILNSDKIQSLLEKIDMIEDVTQSQWVTTLYFNTEDHILPAGTAVRFREYNKDKKDISLEDRVGYIEHNSLLFNKKTKTRKIASITETVTDLNQMYQCGSPKFKITFAILYKRRVFMGDGIKISMDYPMECYSVSKLKTLEKAKMQNFAQIEIKQLDLNDTYFSMIKDLGGVQTIPKYYSLYNEEYSEKAEKKYSKYFDESNGFEYEKKLTIDSEIVFNNFIVKAIKNEIKGYKVIDDFSKPYCFTSFNEYRKSSESNDKVCIMYTGDTTQRISIKDQGEILKNQILKRKKTELFLMEKDWIKLVTKEIIGKSHRIKKLFFIESINTGIIYGIILDYSQKSNGSMYQLEIEYAMSTRLQGKKFEDNIVIEIDGLAFYFRQHGSSETIVKKEDWVKI